MDVYLSDHGFLLIPGSEIRQTRISRICRSRPPFIHHCPKPQSGGKRGDLVLTPLELIAKIAALVPPPSIHRHRYYGVLAPNSPLRTAVTGLATQGENDQGSGVARARKVPAGVGEPVAPESASRSPARYFWALLIARIYDVFPFCCPLCSGQMRIIAFINDGAEKRKILGHIGVDPTPPKITPARAPPLWDGCDVDVEKYVTDPEAWNYADQRTPDSDPQIDQSISW